MAKAKQLYEDNGVELSKASLSVGDEVTLLYSGLLAQSGADTIYAHIGYGENWEGKDFILMEKQEDKFKATFSIVVPDSLNIAFKDSGDNWDNNSQENYSFKVTKKTAKSTTDSAEKKPAAKATAAKAATEKATKTKAAAEPKEKATTAKTTAKKSTTSKKSSK